MISWSYLVPRDYRHNARVIYKECPEIRWHINEVAKIRLLNLSRIVVLVPIVASVYYFGVLCNWLAEKCHDFDISFEKALPKFLKFTDIEEILDDAARVMPISEVEKRTGGITHY